MAKVVKTEKCQICNQKAYVVPTFIINKRNKNIFLPQLDIPENILYVCVGCKTRINTDQDFFLFVLGKIAREKGIETIYRLSELAKRVGADGSFSLLYQFECNYRKAKILKEKSRKKAIVQ